MLSTIRMKKSEGFTLIELMIVIAIIGILAAVAIPQFSAYRIRGFNSSALSDTRGGNTIESAFYADYSQFGTSKKADDAGAVDDIGVNGDDLTDGDFILGPQATDHVPVIAATISGKDRSVPLPLGNLVTLRADTINTGANFLIQAKHQQGDTTYGVVDGSSAVYYKEEKDSKGTDLSKVGTFQTLGSTPSTMNPFAADSKVWTVR